MKNEVLLIKAGSKWKCKCGRDNCHTTCVVVGHSAIIDNGGDDDFIFSVPVVIAKVDGLSITGLPNELVIYQADKFKTQYEQVIDKERDK